MFPWSREFVWDTAHVVFFGALYGVLATIAVSLFVAARRSLRTVRGGRADGEAWAALFPELPPAARTCRHRLESGAQERGCSNAFDCRTCARHAALEKDQGAPEVATASPKRRFYHRGHTWARLDSGGSVTVGLDGMARRLLGAAEEVDLPRAGSRLTVNGTLGRVKTRGIAVRLLSPVDGVVETRRGEGLDFKLRVRPSGPPDLRHLLSGKEAKLWALRELERVQAALGTVGGRLTLADGGELVEDVGAALPRERYDALLGEMFLDA